MNGSNQAQRRQARAECRRASSDVVVEVLGRILVDGRLHRMPRHPERRNVLLALLSLCLERRYPYSEAELNEVLREALAQLRAGVDHVTCRRYLVDLGFVKRDRAGTRYFANYPKVESILAKEIFELDDPLSHVMGLVARPQATRR